LNTGLMKLSKLMFLPLVLLVELDLIYREHKWIVVLSKSVTCAELYVCPKRVVIIHNGQVHYG